MTNKKENYMKSYNHLFEKLISDENLNLAITRSSKNKTSRPEVQEVLNNRKKFINLIRNKLINKTYTIDEHIAERIVDGKPRIVIKPDYQNEQILHHAIIQVLWPIMFKGAYMYAAGSIPKKGSHFIKLYLNSYIRKNPGQIKYAMKLDIRKFFPSINIDLVLDKFKKVIHDEKMLWVLELVLNSNTGVLDGEVLNMGMPVGFFVSQVMAHYFIQDLDHYIKEQLKIKCYVRYVDDMAIFSNNKKYLRKVLKLIAERLQQKELQLKDNYQIFRFDYIDKNGKRRGRCLDFIGFRFYRDKTLISKKTLYKAHRKAQKIYNKSRATWYDASQMLSYYGSFKHTNTYQFYSKNIESKIKIKTCKKLVSQHQLKINRRIDNVETSRKHK